MMIVSFFESTIFSPIQNPSPIRFCTGDHGLAEPNRNHRLAPHNSAKQTGAKASARRSLDQAVPGQTQGAPKAAHRGKLPPQLRQQTGAKANARRSLGQTAPRQTQDTLQTKRRQSNRRALLRQPTKASSRHNSAKQTGAKANARRSLGQAAPRQSQDTHRDKQRRGKLPPSKHPPRQTPATTPPSRQAPRQTQGAR